MPTYDPQRSRSRPRAADDDTPAPVDEILGDRGEPRSPAPVVPDEVAREPRGPGPGAPEAPTVTPPAPPPRIVDDLNATPAGAGGLPREAFIGFAAAVLVVLALFLRRRRRRRRGTNHAASSD